MNFYQQQMNIKANEVLRIANDILERTYTPLEYIFPFLLIIIM
jgi:hypothetical protein